MVSLMLAATVITSLFGVLQTWVATKVGEQVMHTLRTRQRSVLLTKTMGAGEASARRFSATSSQLADLALRSELPGRRRMATMSIIFAAIPALIDLVAGLPITGSGKSTLASLVARLRDPSRGTVRIDGLDLRALPAAAVADLVGVVTQETYLVLDEATSALDNGTERQLQAALEALSRGRTTITIAHRLSTIERADQIAVLDHGRMIELGTDSDLRKRAGAYAALAGVEDIDGRIPAPVS